MNTGQGDFVYNNKVLQLKHCIVYMYLTDCGSPVTQPWTKTKTKNKTSHFFYFRRALDYILFTSDQVHLLPGFPKQQGDNPLQVEVAIYVQYPPGVATESIPTLNKNTLLAVVSESRDKLEKILNVTITSITVAFTDGSTGSSPTVTTRPYLEKTSKVYYIIGGAVAGLIFIIILCLLICRK